ncbi:MAG: enoyl-CoA hydratase-related protein [Planctomycetota bacterium]
MGGAGGPVLVRDAGPVRWLTLNRPGKRNAFSSELIAALKAALRDPGPARLLAISGAGAIFSAGADLAALQKMQAATREEHLADARSLAELFQMVAEHPLPVVAAVNGHALGGGAGLVAACDFAFAVPAAKIGFTEVRLGFVPAIVLNFLLRAVSERVARDLCLTGRQLEAAEAASIGLWRVTDDLEAAVRGLGDEIAQCGPGAVAHTKRLFLALHHLPLNEGLAKACDENATARMSADFREGVAAFLEKRKPEWPLA